MKQREFNDLVKLAQQRSRDSAMLVAQLLDSDAAKASLLLAIAHDFVNGAAAFLYQDHADDEEPLSEDEALAAVAVSLMKSLGVEVIETAQQMIRSKQQ